MTSRPAAVDFHFDVMCPYAYQTSLWMREVRDLTGLEVNWRFFSLEEVNRQDGKKHPWEREWSYVEYRGEHWEVPDVKYLFNRVFKRLWADARPAVIAYSERRGGPVYREQSWNGQWDRLDEDTSLYMGWDSSYMLSAVQGLLEEAGIAPEVFVKYSYIGDAMNRVAGR